MDSVGSPRLLELRLKSVGERGQSWPACVGRFWLAFDCCGAEIFRRVKFHSEFLIRRQREKEKEKKKKQQKRCVVGLCVNCSGLDSDVPRRSVKKKA